MTDDVLREYKSMLFARWSTTSSGQDLTPTRLRECLLGSRRRRRCRVADLWLLVQAVDRGLVGEPMAQVILDAAILRCPRVVAAMGGAR